MWLLECVLLLETSQRLLWLLRTEVALLLLLLQVDELLLLLLLLEGGETLLLLLGLWSNRLWRDGGGLTSYLHWLPSNRSDLSR